MKFFVQANDKVQQIHGIKVQLVAYAFEPRFDYAVGFWRGIGDLAPRTEDSNSRLGGDDYDKNRKSKLGHASENRQATCHPQHQGEEVDQLREEPTPERCPGELSTILLS